jgi:hypothetical protein
MVVTALPLFGSKNKLQVDLGDLERETEHLTEFLKLHLKVDVDPKQNKVVVNSEKIPLQELQHVVTKFVYKRNLNASHFVSTDGNTVKIQRFKGAKKPEKDTAKGKGHQSITQSWGL